jgi:hypothetical protein
MHPIHQSEQHFFIFLILFNFLYLDFQTFSSLILKFITFQTIFHIYLFQI